MADEIDLSFLAEQGKPVLAELAEARTERSEMQAELGEVRAEQHALASLLGKVSDAVTAVAQTQEHHSQVLARHSDGVKSVHRMLPAARSSRTYPTILRNASLASMISPSRLEMKIPMMLASTKRRIFASRSARSR